MSEGPRFHSSYGFRFVCLLGRWDIYAYEHNSNCLIAYMGDQNTVMAVTWRNHSPEIRDKRTPDMLEWDLFLVMSAMQGNIVEGAAVAIHV